MAPKVHITPAPPPKERGLGWCYKWSWD